MSIDPKTSLRHATYTENVALPAFAAAAPAVQQSILPAGATAANPPHAAQRANGTLYRFIDPAAHHADSANKSAIETLMHAICLGRVKV